jgi:predicted transposase YbfD/YdcC
MTNENNAKETSEDQGGAANADSEDKTSQGKKKKVLREEIKDRHTSHWDMDMLSREELERLMR